MKYIKITTLLIICFCFSRNLSAQVIQPSELVNPTTEKGLLNKILDEIYFTYYSLTYMSNKTPVFTALKVDIGWDGKVTGIQFSDSADSAFVKAYFNNPRANNRKDIFEKYAKIKSYSRVSLIIPVSYQPNSPNKEGVFSYDNVQSLTKFTGQSLIGPVVLLPTVIISVLSKNNM